MPISSNTRKAGPFTGTGLVTTYPFNFKVFQAADVYVVRADLTGTESVLVLNTDYTVSLNADQDVSPGGNVVLSSALTSGYTLVITSSIENLQPTDLTNGGGFYPSVITDALDRACIQIQQLQEVSDRSVRVPLSTSTGVQMQLPSPTADRIIGWDNVGTALRNYSLSELATSVAYGAAVSDVFTGTGAQIDFVLSYNPASINNLYVSVSGVVQTPDVDFTWTSGTTLTFTTAPPNGSTVLVRYMQALAQGDVADASVTPAKLSTGAPSWDTSGNTRLLARIDEAQGTDIASAATTNIAGATGNYVRVTGTTTITALGTAQAGARRVVEFTGILTLTHNATSLILPTAANITTAAGDVAEFVSKGSGNWKCVCYQRADGTSLNMASNAEAQAGTATNKVISPATLFAGLNASGTAPIYACRAWVNFNGTGTVAIRASGNVSSITDNGTGNYTVNFTTSMPDANYAAELTTGSTGYNFNKAQTYSAGSFAFSIADNTAATPRDPEYVNVSIFR